MLRPEVQRIFRMERTTNLKLGTPMEHALSTANAISLKVCEVGFLHAGGAYRVGRTRRSHNLFRMGL